MLPRQFVPAFFAGLLASFLICWSEVGGQETERSIALDFLFECELSSWQQAHGYARLSGITEAARDGIWKLSARLSKLTTSECPWSAA